MPREAKPSFFLQAAYELAVERTTYINNIMKREGPGLGREVMARLDLGLKDGYNVARLRKYSSR